MLKESKQQASKEEDKLSLDQLVVLANKLPAAERKTLLDQLALQSQTQTDGQARDKDMWAQAVYYELGQAFGGRHGAPQGPALVKRLLTVSNAWSPVASFMQLSRLDDLTVTERQSVYGLIARLVVEHASYVARKSNAPLSAKLVGSCSANVSALFDNAFPGYLAAGLAPIVARQLTAPA